MQNPYNINYKYKTRLVLTMIPYIEYESKEGTRRIVVINGQAFYQSTGNNSHYPGCWFPFLFIHGKTFTNLTLLPSYFDRYLAQLCFDNPPHNHVGWLMKYSPDLLHEDYRPSSIFADDNLYSRMPHLAECLVPAMRLTEKGKFPEFEAALSSLKPAERALVNQPLKLNEESELVTTVPDKVNEWLIEQNAIVASKVLPDIVLRLRAPRDVNPTYKPGESPREIIWRLIHDEAYWKTKTKFSASCPTGLIHMQRCRDEDDQALFTEYRHIARERRNDKSCLSYFCCCFSTYPGRNTITSCLYRSIAQSNTLEELVKNRHFQRVLQDRQQYHDQQNRPKRNRDSKA